MDHLTSQNAEAVIGHPGIAAVVPALERAINVWLSGLRAAEDRIARLEAAMKQVVDELEEDFDINSNGGPNKSMRLAHELEEALYGPGGF